MVSLVNQENKKVIRVINLYLIFSAVFWIVLFYVTPIYVEFVIYQSDSTNPTLLGHQNVFVVESNSTDITDILDKNLHIKEIEKKQSDIQFTLYIYGLISSIPLLIYEKRLLNRICFPYLLSVYILILMISSIYYHSYFEIFDNKFVDFKGYFWIIRSLPFIFITYYLLRQIFLFFNFKEPELVGNIKAFTEPENGVFTFLVYVIGIIVGKFMWF
jgi:hypothetical protein